MFHKRDVSMRINSAITPGGNPRTLDKHRSYHRGAYLLILLYYYLTYGGYGGSGKIYAPPHTYVYTRICKRVCNPPYTGTYYYNYRNHRKYIYLSLLVFIFQIDRVAVVAFSIPANQSAYHRNTRKHADRRQS